MDFREGFMVPSRRKIVPLGRASSGGTDLTFLIQVAFAEGEIATLGNEKSYAEKRTAFFAHGKAN